MSIRNKLSSLLLCFTATTLLSCCGSTKNNNADPTGELADSIAAITATCPGEVGVAVIINNSDTVTVGNENIYPMMSVFKLHQALAVCHDADLKGYLIDSLLTIHRDSLNLLTWSPMLKDHTEPTFELTIGDLMAYSISQSDNNASNQLFDRFVDVAATDSFIATIIPRSNFNITYTEEEMWADHDKAYANRTTPLAAASLINRIFTDSLVSEGKQDFIKLALTQCLTGNDRISAPLEGQEGVIIAHKTGSGYTDANGVLAASNDVAHITFPDGQTIAVAIFVKDFHGTHEQACACIARLSATIFSLAVKQ